MPERRARAGLIALLVVFAATCGVWIRAIPFDQAPDEWTHYYYNVRFILDHHRLPVAGVDDLSAYQTHHLSPGQRLVARYSYAQSPALNYLLYAGAAWLGPRLSPLDPVTSARLVSLVWGLVFVVATWAACRVTGARADLALAATAAVALNPQTQFSASYINQEAFSLAAAACVIWAMASDARRQTTVSLTAVGLTTGWLLTAKLSFWLLLPIAALHAGRRVWAGTTTRARVTRATAVVGGALLVSGFWLGRNLALYGSITAQSYTLGMMRDVQDRIIDPGVGANAIADLFRRGFVRETFGSAVMRFDYMQLALNVPHAYRIAGLLVLGVIAASVFATVRSRDRSPWIAGAALSAIWLMAAALHIYNSLVWDYQPQGRYLFAALTPTAVYLAWMGGRDRIVRWGVRGLALGMFVLTLLSHYAVWQHYRSFDSATVAAVRHLPVRVERTVIAERTIRLERGLGSVGLQASAEPPYDVALFGLEIADAVTGDVLRTAYVTPQSWRYTLRPGFRFRRIPPGVHDVRLRLFKEWGGVHAPPLRMDCTAPWADGGAPGLCVYLGD